MVLEHLHDAVQKKINLDIKLMQNSPFLLLPTASELIVPKTKKNIFTGEMEEIQVEEDDNFE